MNVPATVGFPLIVNTPPLKLVDNPAGKEPAEMVAPVAEPPTAKVIFVSGLFLQSVGDSDPIADDTLIVPLAVTTWEYGPDVEGRLFPSPEY